MLLAFMGFMVSQGLVVSLGFGTPPGFMVCQGLEVIPALRHFLNLWCSRGSR